MWFMQIDIVTDLNFGDTGKGCVTHHLLKENKYNIVLKTSGSSNAGHSIYHDGQKFVTHLIPAGIFYGIKSIIGKNCLVHPESFLSEIEDLQRKFNQIESLKHFNLESLVKIDADTFVITDEHIAEDCKDTTIGTTKKGTGPAARDKYARLGKQAKDIPELKDYLCDIYKETRDSCGTDINILCEGAQGFYLDINFGEYPYVTSSHCTTAAVLLCGLPHNKINNVYGVVKAYETYVGLNKFEGEDPVFAKMREVGGEFGSTTGRPRQCNFLNIDKLTKAIHTNGVDILVVNKMDVLQQLNCWKVRYDNNEIKDLKSESEFKYLLNTIAPCKHTENKSILFSYHADRI